MRGSFRIRDYSRQNQCKSDRSFLLSKAFGLGQLVETFPINIVSSSMTELLQMIITQSSLKFYNCIMLQ